ncbi:VanZ family protein [Corynebacterium striatum]
MSVTQQSTQQTAHPRHRIQAVPPRHATLRRDSVVVTFLVLAAIAVITLGKSFIEIPGVIDASAHAVRSLDLQMFNGFDNPTIWYGPWTNTIGNFLLFMPLGASLVALGQNLPRVRFGLGGTILAGIALSLGIEVMQYVFALGFSDVDELVFNTLGTAVGAFFFARISKEAQSKVLHRIGFVAAAALTILGCALVTGSVA